MVIPIPVGNEFSSRVASIHGRVCPICGRDHSVFMDRKRISILFIGVYARFKQEDGPACSRCVRREILENAAKDMLCANLIWPFFFCFTVFPQFIFSLLKDACVRAGKLDPLAMGKEVARSNKLLAYGGVFLSIIAGLVLFVGGGLLLCMFPDCFGPMVFGTFVVLLVVRFIMKRDSRRGFW